MLRWRHVSTELQQFCDKTPGAPRHDVAFTVRSGPPEPLINPVFPEYAIPLIARTLDLSMIIAARYF